MENHQGNAVYPQLAVDNPTTLQGLETGPEKPGNDRDDSVRKSVRCKRPPQSFSPGLEGPLVERTESSKTKKQRTKSATAPDRPCDLMPNGDPFLCDLCMSPYVINRSLKRSLKNKRSKHNPAPRNKMDPLTGKILMLCNACSITFDRPRKPRKIVPVPTAEEMDKMLKGAKDFAKKLAEKMKTPEAERLYCPVVRPKACGCLQKYINVDGDADEFDIRAKAMIDLLLKAKELSAEKCYTKGTESKRKRRSTKNQGVGIGNGQKRSKAFEDFVLTQRTHLKDELKLCERAVQKVLMYSNNFLHKKLVTEKSVCRAKPVNGMARKGLLQPFDTLSQTRCCVDNCVMMAITHKKLLQDWRIRANKGQSEHRRVIAEMLTPSAGARTNCYTFITLVTGASRSTIVQVSHQMKQTGGEREPPTHGMKKFWQGNSRRKSTEAVSPSKVLSHLGKTTTSATSTQSVALNSKQSVIASSRTPTTTTSNVIIPVSVNATSSGGSSLTVQRQQLMQIQQQMFEQQVQQQQQQHLLQQQLLQHTIMQQIGQATDGMPQNLPMLQTMIDQLNVQIQNTQQQLQLSLRTMNMIGSQPSGAIGSTQNMLATAENSSSMESHGNFLSVTCNNVESTPTTHSNLLQICGSNETVSANIPHQQSNVMTSSNVSTHFQTNDQGGFAQNTSQILSTLSTQDQQNLQFFNQLSPSQMPGQTHGNMNNSQNYFNNLSMQSNGHTIIQVQQSPAIPPSQHTQYVQTFLPGSQLHKGRVILNDIGSSDQFVIQAYPSMNPGVHENVGRSSQNSVLVQQLNTPVNQGPRLKVPPLLIVNQQHVDCGDSLPSASHLSKELYDISQNEFQQHSTRIDTEHGLLNTPILDLTPAAVTPFVSVTGQTTTRSPFGTVSVTDQTATGDNLESTIMADSNNAKSTSESTSVTGETSTRSTLGSATVIGQTTTGSNLEYVSVTGQITKESTREATTVTGQNTTKRTPEPKNVTSQITKESTPESTSVTDQTNTKSTSESIPITGHTTNGSTSMSTNMTVQTTIESDLESAILIGKTSTGSTPRSSSVTALTSASEGIPVCNVPVSSSQSVISCGLMTSVSAKKNISVPGCTNNHIGSPGLTLTSNVVNPPSCSDASYLRVSHTLTNTKPAVTRFHTSPKSAFHTPHKLAVATCNSSTVCTPSTSLQVENPHTQNVKMANPISENSHQNMSLDFVHNVCVPNVSVTSLSTCKPRSKTARRSQATKVTQSRFPTSSVTIVPSAPLDTSTYLSVPMIQGTRRPVAHPSKRSKVNSSIKQIATFPVPLGHQVQNGPVFLQSSETHPSESQIQQHSQQNVSVENHERVQHTAANVHPSTTEEETHNAIVGATHTSTGTTRPDRDGVMSVPLSLCPTSRNKGTGLQTVTSNSQVTQDCMHYSTHATTKSHSASSLKKPSIPYPSNSMLRFSTQGLVGTTAENKNPYSVSPTTPVAKAVPDTSHMLLNFSGPQLQNKLGSVRQSGNEKHVSGNRTRQQLPDKLVSTQGISASTIHVGSHETPVSDGIHPINCTLVINPAQNQRAMVGSGPGQPIIGQIQPMLRNAATHTRNVSVATSATHLVLDSKNSGDQRTQSATPLPLVHNTTFTIDSETLMRLCQQTALPRTPVVSVDMNTQVNKNL